MINLTFAAPVFSPGRQTVSSAAGFRIDLRRRHRSDSLDHHQLFHDRKAVQRRGAGCSPGVAYTTPQTLSWVPGSNCTVEFVSPHSLTVGTRYVFSSWQDGETQNPRVFIAPSVTTSWTALFNTQYQLSYQITPAGAGTATGPEWVFPGTQAAVTAVPAAGYRFVRWYNVDEQTGATGKVSMYGPRTITAQFAPLPTVLTDAYTVLPVISGGYWGIGALNKYGQVVRGISPGADLWTPESANGTKGVLTRIPFSSYPSLLLNNQGQVLASDSRLWSPASPNASTGSVTMLTLPRTPLAFNDFGQIGGDGYLWTPASANATTGTAVQDSRFGGLIDINNYGQAIMRSSTYSGGRYVLKITLFTPSSVHSRAGSFTELTAPSPAWLESVADISNDGAIVGQFCRGENPCVPHMFIWRPISANNTNGVMQIVSPPAGFTSITPSAINDKGDVVGTLLPEYGGGAYLTPFLLRDGVIYDLTDREQHLFIGYGEPADQRCGSDPHIRQLYLVPCLACPRESAPVRQCRSRDHSIGGRRGACVYGLRDGLSAGYLVYSGNVELEPWGGLHGHVPVTARPHIRYTLGIPRLAGRNHFESTDDPDAFDSNDLHGEIQRSELCIRQCYTCRCGNRDRLRMGTLRFICKSDGYAGGRIPISGMGIRVDIYQQCVDRYGYAFGLQSIYCHRHVCVERVIGGSGPVCRHPCRDSRDSFRTRCYERLRASRGNDGLLRQPVRVDSLFRQCH